VANQHIQDQALAYKAAGMAGTMDQLRVRAFLDAINGTSSLPAPGTAPRQDSTDQQPEGTSGTDGGPGHEGTGPSGPSGPFGPGGSGNSPGGTGGPEPAEPAGPARCWRRTPC
jgi:hypothetical protein